MFSSCLRLFSCRIFFLRTFTHEKCRFVRRGGRTLRQADLRLKGGIRQTPTSRVKTLRNTKKTKTLSIIFGPHKFHTHTHTHTHTLFTHRTTSLVPTLLFFVSMRGVTRRYFKTVHADKLCTVRSVSAVGQDTRQPPSPQDQDPPTGR